MDTLIRNSAAGMLTLALVLWSSTGSAQATSAPPAGPARVLLLTLDKGKQKLYIDKAGAAVLSDARSFSTLSVEPGSHLLWGSGEAEWFHFEGGRSYALIYSGEAGRWCLDDTLHARLFIAERKLTEVTPSAADLAQLTAGVSPEKFEKMRAKAGEPAEPRLPADFKAVVRKSASPAAGLFKIEMPKKVHVDATSISVDGGVTIPIAEIKMLQFYGFGSTNSVGTVPWAALLFKSVDAPSLTLLGVVGNYNDFFSAVELARAGAKASSDTTGASK